MQCFWQVSGSVASDICRHDGTDSPADADDVVVVLNSFHSKIIKVRVSVFLVGRMS